VELTVTKTVNLHSAKTHLSRLVDQVAAGGEVIIAKAGKPMARLVPFKSAPRRKRLGLLKGKLKVPDDFNAPLPASVVRRFEGR
jgi:prevent-host-death family protein